MSAQAPMIDLLPAARRQRRARRTAAGRWATACVLVAVGSLAPAGAMALTGEAPAGEVADRIIRSERSIAQLQAAQPGLRAKLGELQKTDTLLKAIEDRPDWRPMLHAINEAGAGARFERIEMALTRNPTPAIRVNVIALVANQPEARAMVLRFEGLGVFDEVMLTGATTVGLTNADVVRCEITATVRMGGKK